MNGESAIAPRRVHIVGGPASGKTTIAGHIAECLGLPVHHLDDLHRADAGVMLRPVEHRLQMVRAVLDTDGWVTEGIHLGWTDPFFDRADLVIWLDTPGWVRASGRLVRRFGRSGSTGGPVSDVASAPVDRSVGRRLRDGWGHAGDLVGAVHETRHYHLHPRGTPNLPETRTATRDRLDGHIGRLVRCRSDADVQALLASLAAAD
ncbi:MAG: hypothetical protein ABIZ34_01865 [Candidatus Limnocylindrales bacterium]